MDALTLQKAMPGLAADRAAKLVNGANEAMLRGNITTIQRAAMFLAQVGEESVSLRYTEEIADGAVYEGRADLGNLMRGDGTRYKGRSFIQITGRHNYAEFSIWAHANGLCTTPTWFVDNPERLGWDFYAWEGAVWYWTVARSNLNYLADTSDIEGATRAINGGLNGLADRTARWRACLALGAAILPHPTLGHTLGIDPNDIGDLLSSLTPAQQKAAYDAIMRIDNHSGITRAQTQTEYNRVMATYAMVDQLQHSVAAVAATIASLSSKPTLASRIAAKVTR